MIKGISVVPCSYTNYFLQISQLKIEKLQILQLGTAVLLSHVADIATISKSGGKSCKICKK